MKMGQVFLFVLLTLGAPLWAFGGSLDVSPIRVQLTSESSISALQLRNLGADPVVIQVELMKWTKGDTYKPSSDLLVNPVIFNLGGKQSQVVRVGLSRKLNLKEEQAYRIYFQEVLPKPRKGSNGLRTALRLGVPIFVVPESQERRVQWKGRWSADGKFRLSAVNAGNVHVQVLHLKLSSARKLLTGREVRDYLLPGESRDWTFQIKSARSGDPLELTARTDGGDLNAKVYLERL